jgi:hypothetical protein
MIEWVGGLKVEPPYAVIDFIIDNQSCPLEKNNKKCTVPTSLTAGDYDVQIRTIYGFAKVRFRKEPLNYFT